MSVAEKEETEKTWRFWSNKATSRKRICMEMWAYGTQELPEGQTSEDLWVIAAPISRLSMHADMASQDELGLEADP